MRNIPYLILCFFLSLTPNFLNASKIDSLKQLLMESPEEEKAKIYNILASKYLTINIDTAYFYAESSLKISKKYKNEMQEAHSYKILGLYHAYKSEFKESITSYNKAIVIFKKFNKFEVLIDIYDNISIVLSQEGKYEQALEYLFEGLNISEKNNFKYGIIKTCIGIGDSYRLIEKYEKAEEYLLRALALEKQKTKSQESILSTLFYLLGVCASEKHKYEIALDYYYKMFDIESKGNHYRGMMRAKNGISRVYSKKGNHKLALDQAKEALTLAEKTKDSYLISSVQLNIGNEYMLMQQYEKAISIIEKGLELAERFPYILWKKNAYYDLVICYDSLHDYKNAFLNYKIYSQLNDSLKIEDSKTKIAELETKYETEKKEKQIGFLNKENEIQKLKLLASDIKYKGISDSLKIEESKRQIAELETKYETEKKEEQIEVLNQENEIQKLKLDKNRNNMVLMIISICILLASGIFYFLYLRQKQKSKEIIKKYNYDKQLLSSIISTEDKERKRFASDLHDGLGPLLSSVKLYLSGIRDAEETEKPEMVNYATELIDESIKSVRIISNNILPAELSEYGLVPSINRFTKKIQYSKQIEFSIKDETNEMRFDSSTELILYRVIQELINNSIKHSEADMINIKFAEEKKVLDIFYNDNGKGFDIAKQRSNEQGIGLKNIYERIGSLNGNLEIKSSEGQGMQVDIRIKI